MAKTTFIAKTEPSSAQTLTTPHYVVGIDIALEKATVTILQADKRQLLRPTDFDNTINGYQWLLEQLGRLEAEATPQQILIGLEATGRLWENLFFFFERRGYQVVLLHPAQTHQWAARRGVRAKTDKIDAVTIAHSLLSEQARPAYVPKETIASYRELVRLHSTLTDQAARYKVIIRDLLVVLFPEFCQVFSDPGGKTALALLQLYPNPQVVLEAGEETLTAKLHELAPRKYGAGYRPQIGRISSTQRCQWFSRAARTTSLLILCQQLTQTQQHLAQLETELAECLGQDKGAKALLSLGELGPVAAATLRAELGEVGRFARSDQVVSYAGMDPSVRESGKWKRYAKLSKRESGLLRRLLFMVVLSALHRKESALKSYYEQLVKRRLKGRAAMMAVMRKLLRVIYHLLKYGGEYDPTKVWSGVASFKSAGANSSKLEAAAS